MVIETISIDLENVVIIDDVTQLAGEIEEAYTRRHSCSQAE